MEAVVSPIRHRRGKKPLVLVQTWVPVKVHAFIKREAERRAMTVAGWLRLVLIEIEETDRP